MTWKKRIGPHGLVNHSFQEFSADVCKRLRGTAEQVEDVSGAARQLLDTDPNGHDFSQCLQELNQVCLERAEQKNSSYHASVSCWRKLHLLSLFVSSLSCMCTIVRMNSMHVRNLCCLDQLLIARLILQVFFNPHNLRFGWTESMDYELSS